MNFKTVCIFALLFTGCAIVNKKADNPSMLGSEVALIHPDTVATFRNTDTEPPEMQVPEFDNMPDELKVSVDKWLLYFKGRGREHMERYLSRSTRYEKLMKKILRKNELPEDLIYIALIESGFSPRAISRAAAVGYWQFIRGTGKRYGLQINSFIDERRDPEIATQGAADYFKELYGEFNSWFLAMASYNVGEGRIRREIKRNKTNDFWVLAKKRRIPKETVNYVPKFLAARMIAKNPEKFGFVDIPYETPIEFETVTLSSPINIRTLAEKMNIDYPELKRLNPKYRGEIAPLEDGEILMRVPLSTTASALAAVADSTVKNVVFVADRGETDVYKVRRGDTLNRIARRFKTSIGMIKDLNELKRRSRLEPGRTIFVPLRVTESAQWEKAQRKAIKLPTKLATSDAEASVVTTTVAIVDNSKLKSQVAQMDSTTNFNSIDEAIYIVQTGDSLADIALKNNMSMGELMELNNFNEGDSIKVGMQLRVKKLQPEQGEPLIEVALLQPGEVKTEELDVPVGANTKLASRDSEVEAPSEVKPVEVKEKFSNTDALVAASMATAKAAVPPAVVAPVSNHRVKSGDTLERIAKQYGTTIQLLRNANSMSRRQSRINVGTVLIIPGSASNLLVVERAMDSDQTTDAISSVKKHLIKSGESLERIAKMYGTTVAAIKKANNMSRRRNRINAGAFLIIPESENESSETRKNNEGFLRDKNEIKFISEN